MRYLHCGLGGELAAAALSLRMASCRSSSARSLQSPSRRALSSWTSGAIDLAAHIYFQCFVYCMNMFGITCLDPLELGLLEAQCLWMLCASVAWTVA